MSDTNYSLLVQPRFENEVDIALEYYNDISPQVRALFQQQLKLCFNALMLNPFYQTRFKEIRAIPVKRFPYILFFKVIEKEKKLCFFLVSKPNNLLKSTRILVEATNLPHHYL